jgi:hypothetical protein
MLREKGVFVSQGRGGGEGARMPDGGGGAGGGRCVHCTRLVLSCLALALAFAVPRQAQGGAGFAKTRSGRTADNG